MILSKDDFKEFRKEMKNAIKKSTIIEKLDNPKEIRGSIYSKLRELNRAPIAKSITLLCNHYSVIIDDLWPISNSKYESLINIRDRLVHGEIVDEKYISAIWCASNHIRWIIERIIISILSWDIEKSKITPSRLSHFYPYTDLGLYQIQLTGWSAKHNDTEEIF